MAKLHRIENVEIFRTGKWKGHEYTIADLDQIVANFNEYRASWFRPAVKDGHHLEPGAPALGYVDTLSREGDKLVATLVDVPAPVYEAIKSHSYDRVSIEYVPQIEHDGRTVKGVLWALSLLGVEVPEVSGLKPLREALAYAADAGDVEVVDIQTDLAIDGERFALWTAAYINQLPDAAFAVISPGGKKDTEGKTTPRSLRHLPHHTAGVTNPNDNKTVDLPHLRNALARLDQASIPPAEKAKARAHLDAHARALGVGAAAKKNMQGDPEMEKKVEELTAKLAEEEKKTAAMKADLEAAKKHAADLEAEARNKAIAEKVATLKTPALRPHLEAFCRWAAEEGHEDVIKFSRDDKIVELSAEKMIDDFIESMNKIVEPLLKQHSADEGHDRKDEPADDPRVEVDKRTREFMAENKIEDYAAAMDAVLEADEKLRNEYARA